MGTPSPLALPGEAGGGGEPGPEEGQLQPGVPSGGRAGQREPVVLLISLLDRLVQLPDKGTLGHIYL